MVIGWLPLVCAISCEDIIRERAGMQNSVRPDHHSRQLSGHDRGRWTADAIGISQSPVITAVGSDEDAPVGWLLSGLSSYGTSST